MASSEQIVLIFIINYFCIKSFFHLLEEKINDDYLESNCNDLNDTIEYMNNARDGVILSEDPNSDGKTAVNIDKENS